jgi:hypothetical protein
MSPLSGIADFLDPKPAVDPVEWIQSKKHTYLWSKQREVCMSVQKHRYTAVRSCHGPGKSYIAANLACWWIDQHPIGEAFVVTTAPSANQVEGILWRELSETHEMAGLPGRIVWGQVPAWKIGDRMVAFGRKPADSKDKNKAMQAFQGIHARYVLVIIDEATGIPKWLWDAAGTLVTNENSRILAIGNPDDPTSEFEKKHRPASGWNAIKISYRDLPAYSGEKIPFDMAEKLTGKLWVEEKRKEWGEGSPLWQAKVEGEFPDLSDDTLIWPRWIREANERSLPLLAAGNLGADVARKGTGETCVYHNRNGHVRLVYSGFRQDTVKTARQFARVILEHGAPMWIDIDGVGGGPYDNLRAEGKAVMPFQGGKAAYNNERYMNLRAEEYWGLRDDFEQGFMDLDPLDEKLQNQLMSLKWEPTKKGLIKIESKEDMEKRGFPSPDRADAVMMSRRHSAFIPAPDEVGAGSYDDLTSDLLGRAM